MAIIRSFKAGFCTHRSCIAIQGTGLKLCQFPARTFLIEANQRFWLWDTGYSHHFTDATQKGIFKLYPKATPVYFETHEAIWFQLKSLGINQDDLESLIISHFHGDHIAGLKDFPNTQFMCAFQGWNRLKTLNGLAALIRGFIPELIPKQFDNQLIFIESFEKITLPHELHPFTEGYILPKSKSEVILVALPGHAIGHIGAFVHTHTGWCLIASDAAWSRKNYQNQPPSRLAHIIIDSPAVYTQTLAALKQLDQKNIPIILSHEED